MAKQAKSKKKSVLDWLVPVICVVVALSALVGILIGPIQRGIDNNDARTTVLLESETGEIKMTRTVAQTITWLQYYQSFESSYRNYSIYKYYQSIFGDALDLSSLISSSEATWVEQNIYYMEQNLGLRLYTQVDVTSDGKVTDEDVSNSAAAFAIYMASGIDTNPGSYFDGMLESLKHYVSIASEAKKAGVTLDDEDRKEIDESIEKFEKLPEAISFKGSLKKFIKHYVGNAIRESDVKDAYELMALASKYSNDISNENFDSATAEDLAAYVADHKDDFYTAKYLAYTTKNADLVDLFKAATDKDSFLAVAAKEILDKEYAVLVAQLEQSRLTHEDAELELTEEELIGAGFGDLVTYEKGSNDPEEALAAEIFTTDEKSSQKIYLVEGVGEVYLVWFKSASEKKSEVRTKSFPYGGLESYDEIEDFRQALYTDVLASINAESTSYIYEATSYKTLVDNALKAVKDALPSESSASYKADAAEDSLDAWLSSEDRVTGDVYTSVRADSDGNFTECEVAFMISTMALDEATTVNGGYLKYETEDEAKEGKEKLSGKTGIALVSAMSDLSSSATVSSNIREGDLPDDLKGWFFSEDRKMNDLDIIAVEEESTDDDSEESKTTTSYYLVCYRSTQKAWESSAASSFSSEKTTDWMEELEKTVKVNEKALTKLGVDLSED